MLRIGVLLPRSSLFPAFGLDILNGIKACLKQYGIFDEYKLLTDNIGFGIEEAEIYTKAERLLLQEDADVVIVVADLGVGELLEPLFTTSNKLLLLVNMGAGLPESWQAAPTTIVHSLNLSFHARLTGQLAAKEDKHKKGAYVLSYYDAGYRQGYSMMINHQHSGGQPMYTHVTHLKPEEFTLAPLEEFLAQQEDVRTLLCLFSGDMAELFCQAVAPMQEKLSIQLYASPMLLDAYRILITSRQTAALSIKGYTCWVPELENTGNTLYKSAFQKTANKEATLFGVLGWDAGLLLKEIQAQHQAGNTSAAEIVPSLSKVVYESPRGWMKLDANTFHTYGPSQLISWAAGGGQQSTEEFSSTEQEWASYTAENFPADSHSGWRNTYLCI
jgi:branched-chain amino acid transport system substrate-binding protein